MSLAQLSWRSTPALGQWKHRCASTKVRPHTAIMHRVFVYPVPKLSLLYIFFTYDPIHQVYVYTVLCTANGHPLHVLKLATVRMGEELDAACMQRLPAIIECPQVIYVCIYVDRVYVCISGPQAIDRSYIFFTYDPIHQVRIYCIVHSKWPSLTCTCACKLQLYVWARSWMQHACAA